ncbi:MAG: hypothetical protein KatS3mg031_0146 [Chitinophagales bacterium]|nr:MAG: hypothetical protein KatS3mg031_0146 [Chitinophagales bacterium]
MSKILGLDLGTNSIGWAVVEKDGSELRMHEANGTPTKGVVIFPEGVKIEKGTEKSRAAERTAFRSARRLKFRRKLRKYETLKVLAEYALCPLTVEEVEAWRKSGFTKYPENEVFRDWLRTNEEGNKNPYFFRDKFSRQKCDWEGNQAVAFELGRAFYHLAQRRGFKSNRLEQSDETMISAIKDQIQDALQEAENSNALYQRLQDLFEEYDFENRTKDDLNATEQKLKTIWNYITKVLTNKIKGKDYSKFDAAKKEIDRYINRPENLGTVEGGIKELSDKMEAAGCKTLGQYFWLLYQQDRNNPNNKIRTNYTAREEHYEAEFDTICKVQQIPEKLKTALYKAIFFQRPLRSQKGLVGKCTFERAKPRCPVSRPEFEEFRMWSFMNNIKIKTPGDERLRPLTQTEKDLIIPKFYRQKPTFKFEELVKALNPKANFVYYKDHEAKDAEYLVNYKLNTTVSGCPVSAALKSLMGDDWKTKVYTYQTVNAKGESVQRKADYRDLWHVLFTFDDEKKLKAFASEKLKMDEASARKFTKIFLSQGYANLSLKAIKNILPWLKKGLIYSHAVFMANMHKVVDKSVWENPNSRELIEKEIGAIIENHTDETRIANAINGLIRRYRDENAHYSKEAEPAFKCDLESKLKAIYGAKTWQEKADKDILLSDAFELLKKHLKKIDSKDAFVKVKRIDERVIEFLCDNNLISDENQLKNLYHPSDLEGFKPEIAKNKNGDPVIVNGKQLKILPLPKTASIKNPVLMRAMHQLRKLINQLLLDGVIDDQTRVHIELAREVNDANKRAAWKTWQDNLRDRREKAVKEIKDLYKKECGKEIEPAEDDITRYLLWVEQDKREIYEPEGRNISICDIIGPDPKYDIEHTIPRSLSWDNSMMNKTLCSKKFNREVKRNQIPAQLPNHADILQRIESWKKDKYLKLDQEIKKINASHIPDKATKDKLIRKRHVLRFKYEYWKGKYDRFIMKEVPEGFKNSQIVDTGLITRFAKNYLSCLFRTPSDNSNVMVVNGQIVAEFRKAWGLQDEYEKKSRANHVHHCMDALTIACMTKDKYDAFVEQWRKAEEEGKYDVKTRIKIPKPWETFTEDVKNLENEVLIVYASKDNVPKQTKRKDRKRGKIVYALMTKLPEEMQNKTEGVHYFKVVQNGQTLYKVPRYLKGDTVRGSLHQDTFYGAIKKTGEEDVQYVVRKKLADLKDGDLDKIVDPRIREIAKAGREKEKQLKKEMEALKNKLKKDDEESESEINAKIQAIQHSIDHELYRITPKNGKTQYVPIRKVRIKAHITEPLPDFKLHRDVKKHPDGSEKYPYKKWIYVQNDENYGLVFFENADRTKRSAQIIKMIDAAKYFKASNKEYRREHPLVEPQKGMKIRGILKPGTMVLFYKEHPEELWELTQVDLIKRLYFVRKTGKDGRVTFQFHQEARNDEQLKEDYIKQYGKEPPKSLTNGESSIDFARLPVPRLRLSPVNMRLLIQGVDFRITPTGKIEKIESRQIIQANEK